MKNKWMKMLALSAISLAILSACMEDDNPKPGDENPDKLQAHAGNDQDVFVGDEVVLNGTASSSETQETVNFSWTFAARPQQSQSSISSANEMMASFTPDAEGEYLVVLRMTTSQSEDSDTVKINASKPEFINITADIREDRRLEKINPNNGPDYIVKGFYTIDAALTVDPGVIIHFERNAGFKVQSSGSLMARGTSSDSIIFTGAESTKGFWKGLIFEGSDNNINEISFSRISFAGSESISSETGAANLTISSGFAPTRLKLKNTLISHGQGRGISIDYRASDGRFTEFSNNAIRNNDGQALRGTLQTLADIDATLIIQNNGQDVIDIFRPNSIAEANLGEDMTWKKLANNIPVLLNLDVIVDHQLTIQAGLVMEFGNDRFMRVQDAGVLMAAGNENDRIIFSGIEKSKGYWRGLYFYDAASLLNELRFVTIEYAGASNFSSSLTKCNIGIQSGFDKTRLKMANVISRESAGNGFKIEAPAEVELLTFSNNQFTNNTLAGISLQAKYIKYLDENSLYKQGNGQGYIEIRYYANLTELLTGDHMWRKPADESVYHILDNVLIDPGHLEIRPGVSMEFDIDKGLEVKANGKMTAQGTANEKIRFSSIRKEAGSWKGVSYNDSNSQLNIISHCEFEFAGSTEFYLRKGALHIYTLFDKAKVEINNSSFSNSTGFGIVFSKFSEITPVDYATNAGNTFIGLSEGDVFIEE